MKRQLLGGSFFLGITAITLLAFQNCAPGSAPVTKDQTSAAAAYNPDPLKVIGRYEIKHPVYEGAPTPTTQVTYTTDTFDLFDDGQVVYNDIKGVKWPVFTINSQLTNETRASIADVTWAAAPETVAMRDQDGQLSCGPDFVAGKDPQSVETRFDSTDTLSLNTASGLKVLSKQHFGCEITNLGKAEVFSKVMRSIRLATPVDALQFYSENYKIADLKNLYPARALVARMTYADTGRVVLVYGDGRLYQQNMKTGSGNDILLSPTLVNVIAFFASQYSPSPLRYTNLLGPADVGVPPQDAVAKVKLEILTAQQVPIEIVRVGATGVLIGGFAPGETVQSKDFDNIRRSIFNVLQQSWTP